MFHIISWKRCKNDAKTTHKPWLLVECVFLDTKIIWIWKIWKLLMASLFIVMFIQVLYIIPVRTIQKRVVDSVSVFSFFWRKYSNNYNRNAHSMYTTHRSKLYSTGFNRSANREWRWKLLGGREGENSIGMPFTQKIKVCKRRALNERVRDIATKCKQFAKIHRNEIKQLEVKMRKYFSDGQFHSQFSRFRPKQVSLCCPSHRGYIYLLHQCF